MEFATFHLEDRKVMQTTKLCKLTCARGAVTVVPTTTPLTTAFGGPSLFDKTSASTRKSLELRCNHEVVSLFQDFDEWALAYPTEHSDRLFQRGPLTREQIEAMYRSPISQKGDHQPLLRCKINMEGQYACRFWNMGAERCNEPKDWKSVGLLPSIEIRCLWQAGAMCGFQMDVTDLQITEVAPLPCPF